jgi:hypothetical protein
LYVGKARMSARENSNFTVPSHKMLRRTPFEF